jgi:hypothetical protein
MSTCSVLALWQEWADFADEHLLGRPTIKLRVCSPRSDAKVLQPQIMRPKITLLESCGVTQQFQFAVEAELAVAEGLPQVNQKLLPEESAEDFNGKEERLSTATGA